MLAVASDFMKHRPGDKIPRVLNPENGKLALRTSSGIRILCISYSKHMHRPVIIIEQYIALLIITVRCIPNL